MVTRIALELLLRCSGRWTIFSVAWSHSLVADYPKLSHLQVPLVASVVTFGLCVEAVLAAAAVSAGCTRDHRIFRTSAPRLVEFTADAFAVATAVVMITLFMTPGPPALGLVFLGGAVLEEH
jgi:uncharacterized membrane protein YkvI